MEILTGILLGLSTLLFIGPVFFYLLEVTVSKGILAGITVAIAIILGDVLYVYFCLNGVHKYLNKPDHISVVAFTGGLLLFLLGLEHILKKPKNCRSERLLSKKSLLLIFFTGFFLNFVNPFVFAVWVGFLTYSEINFSIEAAPLILGFTLITIFITDVLKVFLAKKLSHFFNPKNLILLRKTIGILLLLFAFRLFWSAF